MEAQQRELRRQLDWLMTFRVVIITTLMICTFVIELMYRPLLSLRPFYLLGVVTYAMTIAYAVLSRTVRAVRPQIYAQLIGDLGVVSGFVYLTGGAESPFSFLYLLTIIIGSILLVRRGAHPVLPGGAPGVVLRGGLPGVLPHREPETHGQGAGDAPRRPRAAPRLQRQHHREHE